VFGIECTFGLSEDGKLRCLPETDAGAQVYQTGSLLETDSYRLVGEVCTAYSTSDSGYLIVPANLGVFVGGSVSNQLIGAGLAVRVVTTADGAMSESP
jgi:hypothetical protein